MPESNSKETASSRVSSSLLYWSYALLGCSLLAPWSALLSAIDYFTDIYPDYDIMRWISLIYMPVTLVSIVVNTFIPLKDRGHGRVVVGYVLFVVTLFCLPLMDWTLIRNDKGTALTFGFLIVAVFLLAIGDGVTQPTLAGTSLYLPPGYYQAFVSGMGISAILMSLLRIITKAAFTESTNGLRMSACVFLLTSAILCCIALLVHRLIVVPHPLLAPAPIDEEDIPLSTPEAATHPIPKKPKLQLTYYGEILKKLKLEIFIMIMVCLVTLTIFPGIASDVKSDALGSWYGVLLVGMYAVGDVIGRSLPGHYYLTRPVIITLVTILRFLFLPMTYVVVRYLSHPFIVFTIFLTLGFSHGYMNICAYGLTQKKLQGVEASFVGGNVLVFAILLGLSLGSLGSIGWTHIV